MTTLNPGKPGTLVNIAVGYTLILVTIWSTRAAQKKLFWIDVAFFLSIAVVALYSSLRPPEGPRLRAPHFCFRPSLDSSSLQVSIVIIALGFITAAAVILASAELGTLHGLFGRPHPLLHGGTYLIWAMVQQWIQQSFFFVRFERVIHSGVLASFTTAALFGLAHLPNPVLAPLTFAGGWLLSELYRRYRTVIPLGIAHGMVGLAVALAVPDSLNHHMRVGLGYLQYMS